jgi:hypothetical protein
MSSISPIPGTEPWPLRLAHEADVSALEALIPLSVRALQSPYYSQAQIEAALGPVFGVDRQLIRDGTYFIAEQDGVIRACPRFQNNLVQSVLPLKKRGHDTRISLPCPKSAGYD